jgi:hypothetical protein
MVLVLVYKFQMICCRGALAQTLYLTRQHYRRIAPSGEDNNGIIVDGKSEF